MEKHLISEENLMHNLTPEKFAELFLWKVSQATDLYYKKLKDHTNKFKFQDKEYHLIFTQEDWLKLVSYQNYKWVSDFDRAIEEFLKLDILLDQNSTIYAKKYSLFMAAQIDNNFFTFNYNDKNNTITFNSVSKLSNNTMIDHEAEEFKYIPGFRRRLALVFEKKNI